MAAAEASDLGQVVALLAAGVIAVPLFKRLGLGSVLGYLTAGLVVGPFGLRLFSDPQAILHIAELGVVMFLFLIGLEMQPSRLWTLRRDIFGLGAAQLVACGALLTGSGLLAGLSPIVAFISGMGFVLSSTAIAMQLLGERGETATPAGQRAVAILLLEDLAIVPLLALVAILTPGVTESAATRWLNVGIAGGAMAALIVVGLYLLNPMFRLLAKADAREVMTAAALLVVLGAAFAMQTSGLSMAMGAFVAGVLLSESTFRHQLEADIEPFRGILLGLFFLGVGMSLDVGRVVADWPLILAGVIVAMALKSAGIYAVARVFGAKHPEALTRAALLAQGGEFAFVLYAAAGAAGLIEPRLNALLTASIIISMALTPLLVFAVNRLLPEREQSMEGIEAADDLHGKVLIIGFGRFGQVVSQSLLARGIDISIIDNDTEMIVAAGEFGFKVYYGDATRLDILRASGAGEAELIAVCVDKALAADTIVEVCKEAFPQATLMVRAFDRAHALKLVEAGVNQPIRETFESAMAFGEAALCALDVPDAEAREIVEDIRRRDAERFALEQSGGMYAGTDLLHGNAPPTPRKPGPRPTPFTRPRRFRRPTKAEPEHDSPTA